MTDGIPITHHTTVSFPSLVEESHTWLPGVYFLCGAGVVLCTLIIKGMMILSGTWDERSEKSLNETPGLEAAKNQIAYGTDLSSMRIGTEVGNR
jgi:hypothetical protein